MPQATPAPNPNQASQNPTGPTAAPQPTPNRGFEAAALQELGLVVQRLQQIALQAGAGSDVGKAATDAVAKLAKFVPPGSVTPAAQRQMIEKLSQSQTQNNQQMQALAQMRQQQAQPQAKAA